MFSALVHSDLRFWAMSTYFGSMMQSMVGEPKDFALTLQYQAKIKKVLASSLPVNPEINHIPLGDVRTPTLVISAVDDPMALHSGTRTLAEQISNARLFAVPDGGHLMLGHTAEVKTTVSQFLRETLALTGEKN